LNAKITLSASPRAWTICPSKRVLCSSLAVAVALLTGLGEVSLAQQAVPADGATTLFQNVRIFDGKNATLSASSNVLIRGNKIESISIQPIAVDRRADTRIIDAGGHTLMPGLIDNHWHAMLARATPAQAFGDVGFNNLTAGDEATDTLMRGFTTIRDVGGPVFGLKLAIDEGIVKGPRIYPSGAMITVTSGHGDFRQLTDLPRTIGGMLTRMEQVGGAIVADSPDEVRVRAREQLMQGASQVKLTAGGGVSSPFSPIDVTTFTEAELRAAVEAAENWGTYVVAHAFTTAAIRGAIAAGVKCIEHGFLMDEATAKLIAEKGVWLSIQPLPEDLRLGFPVGSVQRAKADEVWPGIARSYELAKKYKIKTAWGTDVLFWPRSLAGIPPPKRWSWRHRQTPNCWRCPASAIPIPASSASWNRAHSRICCLSTEIRWTTST
jgi:imidazolonepropionase-like amidohydrolase